MAKSKYSAGTKVRVINPEIFVRCGYPETIESAKEKMLDEYYEENDENLSLHLEKQFPFADSGQLIYTLAKGYLKNKLKFGGRERKVYTRRDERLLEEDFLVIQEYERPKICKSGTYYAGYGGDGYWDDYEPSYLGDVNTHVFYPVGYCTNAYLLNFGGEIWIERKNLEIIED